MPPSTRRDPLPEFNFRVEIDGLPDSAFAECTGLGSDNEVIEYREGGDSRVRLVPGINRYARIVLKRGITKDRTLWEWRKRIVDGQIDRRNGSIILLNAAQVEIVRWNFFDAWPSKWEGPE